MHGSHLIAFIFLALLCGCQTTNRGTGDPQRFTYDPDLTELSVDSSSILALDSLLQSFVNEKKLNCVAGFVAVDGNVIYEKAFGLKDVENSVPATVDDYYVLFSQTKAITTAAFMTLVEEGLVEIDDPVSKYLPEISDRVVTKVNADGTYESRPVTTPMTFVHLMSHSSGLGAGLVGDIRMGESEEGRGAAENQADEPPTGQHSFGGDQQAKYLEQGMLELARYPLGFDPGTDWSYHVSTNMLAYLIERISGEPLQTYVKRTVLDPLGMDETDWYYGPEALSRFVKPYSAKDGKLEPGSNAFAVGAVSEQQTYAEGAIGLNGPIGDYAKFCQMMLNGGEFNGKRILEPETVARMTEINRLPESHSGAEGFQFGLGFELYNERKKHVPAMSNTGFGWGGMLGTEYTIDPEKNVIALLYMNMWEREPLHALYLERVYDLVGGKVTAD